MTQPLPHLLGCCRPHEAHFLLPATDRQPEAHRANEQRRRTLHPARGWQAEAALTTADKRKPPPLAPGSSAVPGRAPRGAGSAAARTSGAARGGGELPSSAQAPRERGERVHAPRGHRPFRARSLPSPPQRRGWGGKERTGGWGRRRWQYRPWGEKEGACGVGAATGLRLLALENGERRRQQQWRLLHGAPCDRVAVSEALLPVAKGKGGPRRRWQRRSAPGSGVRRRAEALVPYGCNGSGRQRQLGCVTATAAAPQLRVRQRPPRREGRPRSCRLPKDLPGGTLLLGRLVTDAAAVGLVTPVASLQRPDALHPPAAPQEHREPR